MVIVLKPKHVLQGKNLLPVAMRLKAIDSVNDIPQSDLARLKREHALTSYSAEDLENQFRQLTGEEAKEILLLAGKDRSFEWTLLLVHIAILYANEVGAPRSTPLRPSPGDSPTPVSTEGVVDLAVAGGSSEVEQRMRTMEKKLESFQEERVDKQVAEALKHVSILAGRPSLTSPSIMIAAVEALVDSATKTGHKDAEYFGRALQACRRFEDNDDLCGLCLKLFGSAEDKKIASAVAEWSKSKKYCSDNKKVQSNDVDKGAVVPSCFPGSAPYGSPMVSPQGWMGAMGYQGHMFPPQHFRFGGFRPQSYGGGAGLCHYCKRKAHYVAKCPKLNVKNDNVK